MKILLLASTTEEITPTLSYLEQNWDKTSFWDFQKDDVTISILISGLGAFFSGIALSTYPNLKKIDYIINPGLGAGISRTLDLGKVYLLEEDLFADLGIEETDGTFMDLHNLKWYDAHKFPFFKGKLHPKNLINPINLPVCGGLTVNKIPGTLANIAQLSKKYYQDMLTLDGAGILYACRILDLEISSFRVVSKYVEPRQNKTHHLEDHIEELNQQTILMINAISATGLSIN